LRVDYFVISSLFLIVDITDWLQTSAEAAYLSGQPTGCQFWSVHQTGWRCNRAV